MVRIKGGKTIVSSDQIAPGVIVNSDINASAGIALSKLATDPLARANHTGSQAGSTISDFAARVGDSTSTLTNKTLDADGAGNSITNIENADIKAAAGIVDTKLATIATAGKVDGAALTNLANIPSAAGLIPAANISSSYTQLATASLGGAATTLSSGTFASRKFLRVVVMVPSTDQSRRVTFTVNATGGTGYSGQASLDFGVPTTFSGTAVANTEDNNSTGKRFMIFDIYNVAAASKTWTGTCNVGTTSNHFSGVWNDTTNAITSIELFLNGAGNLASGTEITVFGHN